MFAIEAIQAQHGDCLLVHFGDATRPRLLVIDGGPRETYATALEPRLKELIDERGGAIPIEAIIATHLDEDHILGLIELCDALLEGPLTGLQLEVSTLWHNTFDDLMVAGAEAAGDDDYVLGAVFAERTIAPDGPRMVIASIPQGDELREKARFVGWPLNVPFQGELVRSDDPEGSQVNLAGLQLTVVGPDGVRLAKLRDEYAKLTAVLGERTAATPDDSVFNLASIVCLLEYDGMRALMTGDALGRYVLEGLEATGCLRPGDSLALDLLKIPHHGSNRNATQELFERLPARHYVISANGKYSNPDVQTLEMLLRARPDDHFTIHLTNRDLIEPAGSAPIDFLLSEQASGRRFGLEFRAPHALSVRVDLAGQ